MLGHTWQSTKHIMRACVLSRFSHMQLFATIWTVSHQALLSMDSPGKNTGVGHHFLLQGIFLTPQLNSHLLRLLHCRQILYCWATREAPKRHILYFLLLKRKGFPSTQMVKICLQHRKPGFDPRVGKIPWRREWQTIPVFLPRGFHGQRSLESDGPWGGRVRHDWVTNTHTHTR